MFGDTLYLAVALKYNVSAEYKVPSNIRCPPYNLSKLVSFVSNTGGSKNGGLHKYCTPRLRGDYKFRASNLGGVTYFCVVGGSEIDPPP